MKVTSVRIAVSMSQASSRIAPRTGFSGGKIAGMTPLPASRHRYRYGLIRGGTYLVAREVDDDSTQLDRREVVLEAVKLERISALSFASDALRNDKDIVLEAMGEPFITAVYHSG